LSRLFEVDYDIGVPANRKIFQAMMEILIDPARPGDFNQALMDLGSDIEAPVNPRPEESPVREFSAAYRNGTMDKYPIKAPKKKPVPVSYKGFVIRNEKNEFLLEKNQNAGLLSGFWSFPLLEITEPREQDLNLFQLAEELVLDNPKAIFMESYQLDVHWLNMSFPSVQHIFSHRKWQIQILEGLVSDSAEIFAIDREVAWVHPDDFHRYPFAKPQQKMWEAFQSGIQ